jgi:MFS family permease
MSLLPREAPGDEDKNLILSETTSSKLLGFAFKSFLLSDIYGRKKMVLIILIIYIIGVSIGGISTSISVLLVARVIQGIGISMFPIAFGIIRDQFPIEKLVVGVGVFSSMFAAGSVVGLAVGGSIIQNFGWHSTFYL